MPSFESRLPVDKDAPKVSKLYILGLFIVLSSLIVWSYLFYKNPYFLFNDPKSDVISFGIHMLLAVIVIVIFAITHTKKDLKYQKEKAEKQAIERAEFSAMVRKRATRNAEYKNDQFELHKDPNPEALEAYKKKWG